MTINPLLKIAVLLAHQKQFLAAVAFFRLGVACSDPMERYFDDFVARAMFRQMWEGYKFVRTLSHVFAHLAEGHGPIRDDMIVLLEDRLAKGRKIVY